MFVGITIFLVSFTLQHEGCDGADRAEREAMHRSHSQLPYFLGRPTQEHTVIKSGYCVKQGAVVSFFCSVGSELGWVGFSRPSGIRVFQYNSNSDFYNIFLCLNTLFWIHFTFWTSICRTVYDLTEVIVWYPFSTKGNWFLRWFSSRFL